MLSSPNTPLPIHNPADNPPCSSPEAFKEQNPNIPDWWWPTLPLPAEETETPEESRTTATFQPWKLHPVLAHKPGLLPAKPSVETSLIHEPSALYIFRLQLTWGFVPEWMGLSNTGLSEGSQPVLPDGDRMFTINCCKLPNWAVEMLKWPGFGQKEDHLVGGKESKEKDTLKATYYWKPVFKMLHDNIHSHCNNLLRKHQKD